MVGVMSHDCSHHLLRICHVEVASKESRLAQQVPVRRVLHPEPRCIEMAAKCLLDSLSGRPQPGAHGLVDQADAVAAEADPPARRAPRPRREEAQRKISECPHAIAID